MTPKKNTLIVRLTLFEDVRLIYQALLVRIFVLEKKGLGGITKENIEMLEADFMYLHRFVYYKEKYMISVDFFRRLADILYYKNGLVNYEAANSFFMMLYFWDYNVEDDFRNFFMMNCKSSISYKKCVDRLIGILPPERYKVVKRFRRGKEVNQVASHSSYIVDLTNDEILMRFVKTDFFKLNKLFVIGIRRGYIINFSNLADYKGICEKVESVLVGEVSSIKNDKTEYTIEVFYRQDSKGGGQIVVSHDEKMYRTLFQQLCQEVRNLGGNVIGANVLIIRDFKHEENNQRVTLTYSKLDRCRERRLGLLREGEVVFKTKNKRTPCYACKYYNRSLKIIIKSMLGRDESEGSFSKVFFFIKARYDRERFYSLKDSDLLMLASSLDGLGNVLFSCSYGKDFIKKGFMDCFMKLIDINDSDEKQKAFDEYKEELSHLEKALLYFWTAAFYYKYSSNRKEAFLCYKKIIHILVSYLEVQELNKERNIRIGEEGVLSNIKDYLSHIKQHIFSRAMQNLYSHYENTNMVEIQKLKWVFSIEMYNSIPLNELSIFPDAEEFVLLYYKLELLCGNFTKDTKGKSSIHNLYKNITLNRYRVESTVSERVVALRFKAEINRRILRKLLPYSSKSLFSKNFLSILYILYIRYLSPSYDVKRKLGDYLGFFSPSCFVPDKKKSEIEIKMDLIEFLVVDSIFCLSKIIEVISPASQTTLFSESYIGGVYDELFEFN